MDQVSDGTDPEPFFFKLRKMKAQILPSTKKTIGEKSGNGSSLDRLVVPKSIFGRNSGPGFLDGQEDGSRSPPGSVTPIRRRVEQVYFWDKSTQQKYYNIITSFKVFKDLDPTLQKKKSGSDQSEKKPGSDPYIDSEKNPIPTVQKNIISFKNVKKSILTQNFSIMI